MSRPCDKSYGRRYHILSDTKLSNVGEMRTKLIPSLSLSLSLSFFLSRCCSLAIAQIVDRYWIDTK